MKKIFVLLLIAVNYCGLASATDHNSEELLNLLKLSPKSTTHDEVVSLLGMPGRVEESKKKTYWYYTHGNTELEICWRKKSDALEQFSFSHTIAEKKGKFDINSSVKLKSGVTNLAEALTLLGTPNDMTIKGMTQEVHYAYQNNVLRLFFRGNTLVDYTLY